MSTNTTPEPTQAAPPQQGATPETAAARPSSHTGSPVGDASGATSRDASPPHGAADAAVPARNLVVCQLPRSVDTKMLRAIFSEFGELVTALVMMDVQSGKSRGFGFVWFKERDDAKRAMEAMNGRELEEGRKLKVFPSEHPDGLSEAPAIDVLNFPAAVAHTQGRRIFAQYGTVVRYEIAPLDGRASGSGSGLANPNTTVTVEFSSVLEARAAVNALHGVREIAFETLNVNLNLPLVTKYLISGAHRPASRAGGPGSRMSPNVSGTSNPQAQMRRSYPGNPMAGSGSGAHFRMGMGGSTHHHPMAPPPAYHSPATSGSNNPMAMHHHAVQPQPVYVLASPPNQQGSGAPTGVFQLPSMPSGTSFVPQPQPQQHSSQHNSHQPSPPMAPPPAYHSPATSGSNNPMAMHHHAVQPQPVYVLASPPNQQGSGAPTGVFQLPSMPNGASFVPQPQPQPQQHSSQHNSHQPSPNQSTSGTQPQQQFILPPGYVMVPVNQQQQQQPSQQGGPATPQFIMQGQPMQFTATQQQPQPQQPPQQQQPQQQHQPQAFFFAPQPPQQQQQQASAAPAWTMQAVPQ
eukprot:CAMPEP_0174878014 /NCGR_PEP_ID=MMETSP1114-20130205/82545_1 /TAXON_ID=312471 /ORGANISM="Neobodo designis, Strain CCAP 1951/1" /LENGTH=574 /DNA_ID=CAMNT_0016113401 /DNA_START=322 /DNA_END=2046 /DNA_ORIENTATION=-